MLMDAYGGSWRIMDAQRCSLEDHIELHFPTRSLYEVPPRLPHVDIYVSMASIAFFFFGRCCRMSAGESDAVVGI